MNLIVIPLVSGYVVGFVFAFRRITGQLAWHYVSQDRETYPSSYGNKTHPDGDQWFGAILLGLLFSVVWPASLFIAYGIAGSRHGGGFFYIPPKERERILQERIKHLEREAGIRA